MRKINLVVTIILGCILFGSLVWSIHLFFRLPIHPIDQGLQSAAEILLVIVISAEGLFAVAHLNESRAERQAAAFRDFMHDFTSTDSLIEREKLYNEGNWKLKFSQIPDQELIWECKEDGEKVFYSVKGNPECKVQITMDCPQWKRIQHLADQFHYCGLSVKRGYLSEDDLFEWFGSVPLKWWRRLGGIIKNERERRGVTTLFKGFEELAELAKKRFK